MLSISQFDVILHFTYELQTDILSLNVEGGDYLSSFIFYKKEINSVFQLLGYKENDITFSIAWALSKCPMFLKNTLESVLPVKIEDTEDIVVSAQEFDSENGITDIEITDHKTFHIIFEAKRGWVLPESDQLIKYSSRNMFKESAATYKAIITMSECSQEYASRHLPFAHINGIPVRHLSWKDIYFLTQQSHTGSNNNQKELLMELEEYLKGVMTMQNKESNLVYVVSLSKNPIENTDISTIEILQKYNKYFCPIGGVGKGGWPKEPPNYIAFRYFGKLQSIHYIESYAVADNVHDHVAEIPNHQWSDFQQYVYSLGPAIIPAKEIKTGNLFRAQRVWAMLDTLMTADSISEARDITQQRLDKKLD